MEPKRTPSKSDERKVKLLKWMRTKHFEVVNKGSVRDFRRRRTPTSGMPSLVTAASKYRGVLWAPKDLMVPARLPPEAKLPKSYMLRYYGLGKLGWSLYNRHPIDPAVPWDPTLASNRAFPQNDDGWTEPTSDESFARLRLQGPNPWLLTRDRTDSSSSELTYKLDFSELLEGVLPPIVARFAVRRDEFVPLDIKIGDHLHQPGDPTWDQAKRVVNAADIRYVPFVRHLLETHMIVGQAFALSAFALPTWHPLRPFMQFFTYGTLEVTNLAYKALLVPSSYFIASGFLDPEGACLLFNNGIAQFDLDQWIVPRDLEKRGLRDIPNHPYVDDANLVWPAFVDVVDKHIAELGLDDETIAADLDLQSWYFTLAKILPNTEPSTRKLDRARLAELCTALLWNNVVHEVCGDLSPILGSQDPLDKAITNLEQLRAWIGTGSLTEPAPTPSMADVFLMDQASYVSRFNVGGNKILDINAPRWVDDPRLQQGIDDLKDTLRELEVELARRNEDREVNFARMLPSNWEVSISF